MGNLQSTSCKEVEISKRLAKKRKNYMDQIKQFTEKEFNEVVWRSFRQPIETTSKDCSYLKSQRKNM